MKRKILTLAMASLATVLFAADRTWDGGGSDANWGTAANWGGTAPSTNDALFFGGAAKLVNTNDLSADTPFAGVMFNSGAGAFTLAGNRITLDGNITNRSTSAQTINLDLALSGTRTLSATSGAITVNGAISGAGGLTKTGIQPLILSASNSYAGVTTVKTGGVLRVTNANALGSTNGATVVENGGWLEVSGNITVPEAITLSGDASTAYAGVLRNTGGTNVWSGPITTTGTRIKAPYGQLIVTGGVTGPGVVLASEAGAGVTISNLPVNVGSSGGVNAHSPGTLVLAVSNNVWSWIEVAATTLRTDVPNALAAAGTLQMGVSYSTSATVDLNGNNQIIGQLISATLLPGTRILTSPTPATLTVNQSASTIYDGQLNGRLGLAKTGAGTLTLSNSLSTTTGDITVSNGTLVVALASGLGNSTNVTVSGTGILELRTSSGIADAASLSIADGGAKVNIGTNLTETVNALFLGGIQQRRGTYGASAGSGATTVDTAHFSGDGKLFVSSNPPIIPTNYVWDAGGTDSNIDNPTNWVADALPDFGGTSYAVFGSNGVAATVNTNVSLYGLTFNRDGNFTLANGAGALTLGMGGVFASAPTATARAYTLSEDVTLIEHQAWNVTNILGGTTLTVSGNIGDGTDTFGITKTGNGALVLSGTNTYDGVTTNWVGSITVASSNALGSTLGGTVINTFLPTSARLELTGGITLAEPLTFIGAQVNGYCLQNVSGTNTLTGLINTTGGRHAINGGTTLIVTGGITNNPFFVINGSGTLIVRKTPLTMGTGNFYADDYSLTIIDVASNLWGELTVAKGVARMNVKDALPPTATIRMGLGYGPLGTLDLNGFDQTTTRLYNGSTTGSVACVVTSVKPATLTINQSTSSSTYEGQLTGAVGLFKTGTGALILTNTANAANTTVGNFTVSNGTLVVTAASSLGNSTNIVVGGNGTLLLSNSVAIANSAVVRMPPVGTTTAKINLAAGVNETVGWLYLGDKLQRSGTYGSTSSSAALKDDTHFAGAGVLTVLHDKSGSVLRVQ